MSAVEAPVLPPLPALVIGTVSHARRAPVTKAFQHSHYHWLIDLDAIPRLRWPLRYLARFDARDHLDKGRLGGGIKGDLVRWLRNRGVEVAKDDRLLMLAHARVFGHVFDPLTVFWCLRADGSVRAVVFEVHNTYGERHAYLLPGDSTTAQVEKEFYVSPFNDASGSYDVQWRLTRRQVRVSVALRRDQTPILAAVTSGRPEPATTPALVRTFLRHLFVTYRVSALIRWHGVRLAIAGLPVVPRPRHSQEAVR